MRRDITFWQSVQPYASANSTSADTMHNTAAHTVSPRASPRDQRPVHFTLYPDSHTLEWRIPKSRGGTAGNDNASGVNAGSWRSKIITAAAPVREVECVTPCHTSHTASHTMPTAQHAYSQYRRPKEKTSIGIACVRYVHGSADHARGSARSHARACAPTWQILLVQKRHTYAYNSFVHGQYNPKSAAGMVALFDQMTVDEKHTILSLDYQHIWYRVWLNYIPRASTYFNAKNKFERCFAVDGGKRLRALIESSTNSHCLWEIPKGKKKTRAEADIHCAVREFAEETNFTKKHYTLWPRLTKTTRVLDAGCIYVAKYFIALAGHSPTPRLTFRRRDQIGEIAAIEWMSIEDVRRIDYDGALEPLVRSIFNCAKKQLRV